MTARRDIDRGYTGSFNLWTGDALKIQVAFRDHVLGHWAELPIEQRRVVFAVRRLWDHERRRMLFWVRLERLARKEARVKGQAMEDDNKRRVYNQQAILSQGLGGLGNGGQPAIEPMERAAYARGVADERKRLERAISQVRVAIEKLESDAPMSAMAHVEEACRLMECQVPWDRKPHKDWRITEHQHWLSIGPYTAEIEVRGPEWVEWEIRTDSGTVRQRGMSHHGPMDEIVRDSKLEAEEALRALLRAAMEELK